MLEFFRNGYQVVVGSPYGDLTLEDEADCEIYASAKLEEVDHEAKVAYFYDKI